MKATVPPLKIQEFEVSVIGDATLLKVSGTADRERIAGVIHEIYPRLTTNHLIWDFSGCDLTNLTTTDFRAIATFAKDVMPPRIKGRTAYVGAEDIVFGLSCMYTAYAAMAEIPVEYAVFRSVPEAIAWIESAE